MKEYEMKVETHEEYKGKIHEWYGSELFEAENADDALDEAIRSEFAEHLADDEHHDVTWTRYAEHGTVEWTFEGVRLYEYIEMVERSE